MNVIQDLPPVLEKGALCAIDTEIYGARKWKLHRPKEGNFASIQFCPDGETVYVVTEERKVAEALKRVSKATPIFHNAKFDIAHIRGWCNYPDRYDVIDTMMQERILWSGFYDSFGLKDLARRYLGILVSKKEREEFSTATEMTREMLEYAALDASLTWKIAMAQQEEMSNKNYAVYENIDLPAMYAVLDLKGFKMDVDKWLKIAETKRTEAEKIRENFTFNPNSPKQVLAVLQSTGLRKLTSTGADELAPYKEHPLVGQILRYRELAKASSTYGEEFIEKYVEDGYVYADYNVSEAQTGRMSSTDPNLQNIPSAKEYRSCFIASDGNELGIMDYTAQEPCITADESQDMALLEIIRSGKDVHLLVGQRLFQDPTMVKSDPRRKLAKAMNLGMSYGLTAQGLQRKVNNEKSPDEEPMSDEEAEEIVSGYFRQFWGVKQWIDDKRASAQKCGYVETKSGRRMYVNRYSYSWLNNAINAPIQGGAADCTKTALATFRKACYDKHLPFPVVNVVHDEIVVDIPKGSEEILTLLDTVMCESAHGIYDSVPFRVEKSIGKDWGAKS